jgi:MFS superfamily sulfate permease-like transporter
MKQSLDSIYNRVYIPLGYSEMPDLTGLSMMITVIMGCFQLLFSLIQFGRFISVLLPPALIGSLTTATGFSIFSALLSGFMGLSIPKFDTFKVPNTIYYAISNLSSASLPTMIIGFTSIVLVQFMIFINSIRKARHSTSEKGMYVSIPEALFSIIICTILVYLMKLDIKLTGEIPNYFQAVKMPWEYLCPDNPSEECPTSSIVYEGLIPGFALALIASVMTTAISKTYPYEGCTHSDFNQDIAVLGIISITTSIFFRSLLCCGSLSNTAVSIFSGSKSRLTSFMCSVFIMLSLFFFSSVLSMIPETTIAGITFHAIKKLIFNIKQGFTLLRERQWTASIIWWSVFLLVICKDVIMSITVGICLSLMSQVWNRFIPGLSLQNVLERQESINEEPSEVKTYPYSLECEKKPYLGIMNDHKSQITVSLDQKISYENVNAFIRKIEFLKFTSPKRLAKWTFFRLALRFYSFKLKIPNKILGKRKKIIIIDANVIEEDTDLMKLANYCSKIGRKCSIEIILINEAFKSEFFTLYRNHNEAIEVAKARST